jgi:hypothetical protein
MVRMVREEVCSCPMEMCEACKTLKRSNGRGTGHPSLVMVGDRREMSYGAMRADEQDFECRVCGKRWMHETGNAGYGWVEK